VAHLKNFAVPSSLKKYAVLALVEDFAVLVRTISGLVEAFVVLQKFVPRPHFYKICLL
jgi:hypothetical protein